MSPAAPFHGAKAPLGLRAAALALGLDVSARIRAVRRAGAAGAGTSSHPHAVGSVGAP